MAWIKSILAGILAMLGVFAVIALGVAGCLFFWGGYVGILGRDLLRTILLTAVLSFAAGFWWQYRKPHS